MSTFLEFLVKGSEPEPYRVVFRRAGEHLIATCTCQAAINGQFCKHRGALLDGDVSALVSGNASEVNTVASMLSGSDAEKILAQIVKAEAAFEAAKRNLSNLKRALGRVLSS